ncbi:hypothetical protein MRO61_24355 [Klebsiella pneumoniae]|uniref:hypothetical protein n=1 Tax=Klebsiella pneumoniae TaxID=573 RepID=UPI0020A782D0|nr:hypothetical protein [Klebsiella pneumoniae]MCP3214375.1 hypothetical protein [Klebsiella pneumoniae]HCO1391761.1 hypothetical protein [Escherichia coli]
MTTDITELAQSHELRNKVNHRLYGALEFQGTSGEHATITLSIDECKSIIAALDERLTLVEALEKAQQRIAELESRTVKLPKFKMLEDYLAEVAIEERKQILVGVKLEFHRALSDAGIKVEAE